MVFTAAVVGAKGSGKTTFLGELNTKLEKLGHRTIVIQLRSEHSKPFEEAQRHLDAESLEGAIILLDGAEQLRSNAWRKFEKMSQNRKGLIISTHKVGRLPTLFECCSTFELLSDLVFELDPAHGDTAYLHELFDRYDGNIRLCLRALYDRAGSASSMNVSRHRAPV